MRRVDEALEQTIRELLRERTGTICPSEAARSVGGDQWRELMAAARAAGRRMAARSEVVVMQRGKRVDPSRARGPIRFARGPAFPAT